MTIVECNDRRLVVQSGTRLNKTTLILDKDVGQACVERSVLLWRTRVVELGISEIKDIDVKPPPTAGRSSSQPVLRTHAGQSFALPIAAAEADETVAHVRHFLGLT